MAKKYLDFEGLSHFKGKLDVVLAAIDEKLVEMYYTKGEVDVLIDDLQFGIMKKVDALPAVGEEHIIYLVPKVAPATGFDEYIWLADEQDYELIGATNIDLSDYYTKAEVDAFMTGLDNAIEQAERLNVELEGSVITITNKEGVEKEIDLQDATDERVFINCSTTVEGTSVSGLSINVYYGDVLHTTLTTNAQGSASIDIPNGTTYRIVFPRLAGCNPIPDVRHTAVMSQRSVEAVYVEEFIAYEHVKFNVKKADSISDIQPFEGVEVKVEYGEHIEHYISDAQGVIEFDIPIGTTYAYAVTRPYGYYMYEGRTSFTKTALSSLFEIAIKLVPYETGIYIVTQQGGQYPFDEFQTAVEGGLVQRSDAKLIKIATELLCSLESVFAIGIDDVVNKARVSGQRWQNPESKLNVSLSDYDGYINTVTLLEQGVQLNAEFGAAATAYNKQFILDTMICDGFLPSVGQYNIIQSLEQTLNEMIEYTRPDSTNRIAQYFSGGYFWLSKEVDATKARAIFGNVVNISKTSAQHVVWFYTI